MGGGLVFQLAVLYSRGGARPQQQLAVLGGEQEDQPVDQPQQLTVIVLTAQLARAQPGLKRGVGRVGQEAAAQGGDRGLHAIAQPIQRASALLLGRLRPDLQPATFRFSLLALHPRLVADQPQHHEIGVHLPGQNGFSSNSR